MSFLLLQLENTSDHIAVKETLYALNAFVVSPCTHDHLLNLVFAFDLFGHVYECISSCSDDVDNDEISSEILL